MPTDTIVFAGLLPHAPVLVPGVGRERLRDVRRTVEAMQVVARRAVAARPDTVVVISPHSPRRSAAYGLWERSPLRGSFRDFGAEEGVALPTDPVFLRQLEREAGARGVRTWRIETGQLDHGATVPLWYLAAAGWMGPTVVLGLSDPEDPGLDACGAAIAAAAGALRRRVAVIASGDMSHRLTPSAPCGYDPAGARFDRAFIKLLRHGAPDAIRGFDPALAEPAAEDAVDSTRVAMAATGFAADGREVLSYEGPFGVGYGVAVLFAGGEAGPVGQSAPTAGILAQGADLPGVARASVAAALAQGPERPPFTAAGELAEPHALFVTLRDVSGELRGCTGTVAVPPADQVRQTWEQARASAFHDPRFRPLEAAELSRVRFSVSVLDPPEPVESAAALDPAIFGVLVRAADGRRGVLLPGIEGVDTAERQLELARRKGRIGPDEPIEIRRFTTRTFSEAERVQASHLRTP